jgi:hypothetical protein
MIDASCISYFIQTLVGSICHIFQTIAVFMLDAYSYMELYLNLLKRYFSSFTSQNKSLNSVVFIHQSGEELVYSNITSDFKVREVIHMLDTHRGNGSCSPFKSVYIENTIQDSLSRIIVSKHTTSHTNELLEPSIFETLRIGGENHLLNISINKANDPDNTTELSLKTPVNYYYKTNEVLDRTFIHNYVNQVTFLQESPQTQYTINIMDNKCNFVALTQEQTLVFDETGDYSIMDVDEANGYDDRSVSETESETDIDSEHE